MWEKPRPTACILNLVPALDAPFLSNSRCPISQPCPSALRITRRDFLSIGDVAEGGSVGETALGSDEPAAVLCAAPWMGWPGEGYWPSITSFVDGGKIILHAPGALK